MPEFICVQCFKCSTFQVQQVKKVNKFGCSMCQTKQAVAKVHAISSSAKDVRGVVMDLNAKRAMVDEATENAELVTQPSNRARASAAPPAVSSRWQDFVLQGDKSLPDNVTDDATEIQTGMYVTSVPEQRKRKGQQLQDDHTGQITKPPTYPRPLKLACKGLTPDKANLHAIPPALSKPRNFPSSSRLPASAVPQLHNVTNSYTDVFQRAQAKSATTEQCRPPLHTLRQQQPFAAAIAKQCRPGLHTALTAATTKHCRPPLHTPMPTADKQNCAAAPVAGRWSQYVAVETQALADVSGSESYTLPALLAGCDADDCFVTCLD